MLRRVMKTWLAYTLVVVTACSTSGDGSDSLDAPTGKADALSHPSGPYTNQSAATGDFASLTLNPDFTFTAQTAVECITAPCAPLMETGTYLFTHSPTKHYIRFYSDDGNPLARYEWTQSALGELHLRLDSSDHWFALGHGATCVDAGGSCVALAPGSCATGTVGDATQYSCGGGLGVECCLPQVQSTGCMQDTDCANAGPLPQFCSQCADGTTECAHWSCVENECKISGCAS
jgi:hypothetical protein